MPRRTGPLGNNSLGAASRLLLGESRVAETSVSRLARCSVFKLCDIGLEGFEPILSIWVEPEIDPGSQCRDYNALRCPCVYRVVIV